MVSIEATTSYESIIRIDFMCSKKVTIKHKIIEASLKQSKLTCKNNSCLSLSETR